MDASTSVTPPGIDPVSYQRRWFILGLMCLSLVLVVATVSSVNVAIPSIAAELKPTDTQLLWIVDAYAVAFAGLLLPAGALGDKYGRKGALQVGFLVFITGSVLSALCTDANLLIAMRVIMGAGAALIMPSTLSLLTTVFPPAERPKAFGIWSGFAGAGGALGPLLGGALVGRFWFGSVFLVPAAIAAIALVAISVGAPRAAERHDARTDLVGTALSVVGFVGLLFGIIEGGDLGWGHPFTIVAFVSSIVGFGAFVAYESRRDEPLLDVTFFRNRRFSTGAFGITFVFLCTFSLFYVLTQYLQYVQGNSPFMAGVRGLPFAFTMILVAPRGPRIVLRFGLRRTVTFGMSCVAIGLAIMSFVGSHTGYAHIVIGMVFTALGPALCISNLTTGIISSVPPNKAGVGSAVNDVTREVGGAIGIALIGTVANSVYKSRLTSSLDGLPRDVVDFASDSVAKANIVARQLAPSIGDDAAAHIVASAKSAFIDAIGIGLKVSAALAVVVAVIFSRVIPTEQIRHD